jgi:Ni,Fe-hydrogenase I cytochrome b subunit
VYTEMVEMGNFIYVYFTTVKNKKKREWALVWFWAKSWQTGQWCRSLV